VDLCALWFQLLIQPQRHRITETTEESVEEVVFDFPLDLPLVDPRHRSMCITWSWHSRKQASAAADEVPVGAIVVSLERGIIAQAHNQREMLNDPTAHAEMIA
jgi:hypothetical protein